MHQLCQQPPSQTHNQRQNQKHPNPIPGKSNTDNGTKPALTPRLLTDMYGRQRYYHRNTNLDDEYNYVGRGYMLQLTPDDG